MSMALRHLIGWRVGACSVYNTLVPASSSSMASALQKRSFSSPPSDSSSSASSSSSSSTKPSLPTASAFDLVGEYVEGEFEDEFEDDPEPFPPPPPPPPKKPSPPPPPPPPPPRWPSASSFDSSDSLPDFSDPPPSHRGPKSPSRSNFRVKPAKIFTLPYTKTAGWSDKFGIAHAFQEGKENPLTLFNAIPGEVCDVEIFRTKGVGACLTVHDPPSPLRTTPLCKFYHDCGGCSFMHVDPAQQRRIKHEELFRKLEETCSNVPQTQDKSVHASPYGYRRKADFMVRCSSQTVQLGFRSKRDTLRVANFGECVVLHPLIGNPTFLTALRQVLSSLPIVLKQSIPVLGAIVFDNPQEGRADPEEPDQGVSVVIRHMEPMWPPDIKKLVAFANEFKVVVFGQFAGPESIKLIHDGFRPSNPSDKLSVILELHSSKYYPQLATTATADSEEVEQDTEKEGEEEESPDKNFVYKLAPNNFLQINKNVNNKLVEHTLHKLDLQAGDIVFDMFSGLGNYTMPSAEALNSISLRLQQMYKDSDVHTDMVQASLPSLVVAIELEKKMVELAISNAGANNIECLNNNDIGPDDTHNPCCAYFLDKDLMRKNDVDISKYMEPIMSYYNQRHEQLLKSLYPDSSADPKQTRKKIPIKLVMNPPRNGAVALVHDIKFFSKQAVDSPWEVTKIVYVSCNQESLVRDSATLTLGYGFRLVSAGIADMFTHTSQSENIVVFERDIE